MVTKYAVRVSGTHTNGDAYTHFVKGIRSMFIDCTENIRDAAVFDTKQGANILRSKYMQHRSARRERVEIVPVR